MMSANITAASTSWRRTGWSVTSAHSSGCSQTSKSAWRSRIARYSGSERPAWRMNQTGVRSTGSRRAARTRSGSTRPRLASRARPARRPLDASRPPSGAGRARSSTRRSRSRTRAPRRGAPASVQAASHWLDERGNPIVWDGLRTELPRTIAPGERVDADARACAARSRPAATGSRSTSSTSTGSGSPRWAARRSSARWRWRPRIERRLAARGGDPAALAAQEEPLVPEDEAEAIAVLGDGVAPRRTGRAACSTRTRRATRSSAARSTGRAACCGAGRASSSRASRGRAACPGFRHPLVCLRPCPGSDPGHGRTGRGPACRAAAGRRAVALRRPHRRRASPV